MNCINFIKERLNSKWKDSYSYEFTLTSSKKISPIELQSIEDKFNISFPNDYIQFVSEVGLCRLDARWQGEGGPNTFFSMLTPEQIIEILNAYKIWTDEHTYFDESDEDELEIKKVQQSLRNNLIPFQYYGDETAWDFYCFVKHKIYKSNFQIIVAYHDDDELDLWFEGENSEKIWGFGQHIFNWIETCKVR